MDPASAGAQAMPLADGSSIKCAAGTVADDFGSHFRTGKGIESIRPALLFGKIAGLERIRIPERLGIALTASQEEQRQKKQNRTVHRFLHYLVMSDDNSRKINEMGQDRFSPCCCTAALSPFNCLLNPV